MDKEKLTLSFFLPMIPPTVTHQQKRTAVRNGRQYHYEDSRLKDARAKLTAHLSKHIPPEPLKGPVCLRTVWFYPLKGKHADGDYKTTKPDTDNIIKLLKDVMTDLGYWRDDAQVAEEHTVKVWGRTCGIYVKAEELPKNEFEPSEV